jgi:hypothetical protein
VTLWPTGSTRGEEANEIQICVNALAELSARHLRSDATHKEKITMKKFMCSVLLCGIAAIPAMAQGGAAGTAGAAQTPQAAPTDPFSTFVKAQWGQVSKNLISSADQMPEANFSMKLGTTPEVRTYGSLVGHVIYANFVFCSRAKGEANPNTTDYEKTPQTKDQLVKGLHAAMDYCGPLYESLTDASGMMMVTPPAAPGRAPGRPYPFVQPLVQNIIHNNEEYGNIVGYFRVANLVPPSTVAANAAAAAAAGRGRGN